MSDPSYRDNAAPPPPPAPPRFSPLRPLKRAAWWLLTETLWDLRDGGLFGALLVPAVPWCLALLATGTFAFSSPGSEAAATGLRVQAMWCFGVLAALPVLLYWLRSAMRLDEPETRAWWEERFR